LGHACIRAQVFGAIWMKAQGEGSHMVFSAAVWVRAPTCPTAVS
jgi:hypothetical protein